MIATPDCQEAVALINEAVRKIWRMTCTRPSGAGHAAALIEQAVLREGIAGKPLAIHRDNGSPLRGSTYLAKLADLRDTALVQPSQASATQCVCQEPVPYLQVPPRIPGRVSHARGHILPHHDHPF